MRCIQALLDRLCMSMPFAIFVDGQVWAARFCSLFSLKVAGLEQKRRPWCRVWAVQVATSFFPEAIRARCRPAHSCSPQRSVSLGVERHFEMPSCVSMRVARQA